MYRSNRLSLSIAGTAAVALASLPLGVSPASAAKVSEGTTSSIGVIETSSDTQQFNLKTEGASAAAQFARVGRDEAPNLIILQTRQLQDWIKALIYQFLYR